MNPLDKAMRVARIVAHLVNTGQGWNEAVEQVAHDLDVSQRAVWACVAIAREALSDPYLESIAD